MADAPGHVDVVYLPYLPLTGRTVVGDWELIPRSELQTADCLHEGAEELARGLSQVYVLPREAKTSAGVFARPTDERIGNEARDMQRFADLRRACVTAVLDPNPDPTLPDEDKDWNAGHWMLSTENATVVGHGINATATSEPTSAADSPLCTSPLLLSKKRTDARQPGSGR
jgi:hypothetical protein